MKGKFKPTLTTIEEEYCIPDEVIHKIAGIFPHVANENIQQYGERIKNGIQRLIDNNCWALIVIPENIPEMIPV